jgi:hypothetical protein
VSGQFLNAGLQASLRYMAVMAILTRALATIYWVFFMHFVLVRRSRARTRDFDWICLRLSNRLDKN